MIKIIPQRDRAMPNKEKSMVKFKCPRYGAAIRHLQIASCSRSTKSKPITFGSSGLLHILITYLYTYFASSHASRRQSNLFTKHQSIPIECKLSCGWLWLHRRVIFHTSHLAPMRTTCVTITIHNRNAFCFLCVRPMHERHHVAKPISQNKCLSISGLFLFAYWLLHEVFGLAGRCEKRNRNE